MRVAIATEAWNQPTTSFFTYAGLMLNAARVAGVDAFKLALPSPPVGVRVGGLMLPWFRQTFRGYPEDADVIHHTSHDARRGVDVVTIHDLYPVYDRRFADRFRRAAIRTSSRRARRIVVTNAAMARELGGWLPETREKLRVVAIPHAEVDAHRLEPVYDGLWIGRHAPNKRLEDFLRLAEQQPNRRFAVRWTYSPGRPRRDEELENALARATNVTQLPALPDDELDRLYRQSRAVVSTSTIEGWHRPVTEGYLRGCRVVLPRIEPYLSIFPEAIPCWYVADAQGQGLREAFERAVSDTTPVRPDPAFVDSMSFPTVGRSLRAVYEEVAGR